MQASAWRLYLLYRSQFLLLHETAPILASLCKQFLHTLSLLCWFHVKQAWDENGKAKVQPKEQWPEMYGKLEKIMYAKTWEKVRQLAIAFVQCYQESQPAAVKYFQDNWFCEEWICQWVGAARRFQHADHHTNLPIEKYHAQLKYEYMNVQTCVACASSSVVWPSLHVRVMQCAKPS